MEASVIDALADELRRHPGESLVVCGIQDVAVQTVVAGLNDLLGNIGRTIEVGRPSLQSQADDEEMARLVADMQRGDVHALILYGVNPAYDYPDAAAFVEGLERVALSVSFADRLDETASRVQRSARIITTSRRGATPNRWRATTVSPSRRSRRCSTRGPRRTAC